MRKLMRFLKDEEGMTSEQIDIALNKLSKKNILIGA